MLKLLAPLTGIVVPLERVPDPVFAQRLAGDGISIDPLSTTVLAPCDGRVLHVHRAGHALTLSAAGLEIVIHIGLDTVNLKGKGFTPRVSAGAEVRAGDPLIDFDADYVAMHARSLLTEILITNMDRVANLLTCSGEVHAGRDELIRVEFAETGTRAASKEKGERVESEPIIVTSDSGLHARPAAVVATTARQFAADARLVKGDREANARSVVSIMTLEVNAGDTIKVVAQGEDAERAVAAISQILISLTTAHAAAAVLAPTPEAAPVAAVRDIPADDKLRGVAASPGTAIGTVVHLRYDDTVLHERAADPNQERRTLDAAIAAAQLQLEALQDRLIAESQTDKAAIFGAHQELLKDPEILDAATEAIREGASAAFAWRNAYTTQAERLLTLRNEMFAGRAVDLRDVGRRVLHLIIGEDEAQRIVPPDSIIVAEDLSPSDAASLDRSRVRGFCTTVGSATSHVAILARGLGIPAVAAIDPRVLDIPAGTRVVLNGDAGTLQLAPSAAEEAAIAHQQASAARRREAELTVAANAAITRDGHRIEVVANIGDVEEAARVADAGGEGIGLLRSEFLFMDRRAAPDEEEQLAVYENIARAIGRDRILVIRTLDVGGDKPVSYLPMNVEANPFLGERGIRLSLNQPDVLRTQIRAMLRATRTGRIAIMFPMIATIAEWRAAREMVLEESRRLNIAVPQIGIMVETAAAALIADRFAEDADFFSVGTNDLTQYTLAMDRTNARLAPHVDAMHPSVLRLVDYTVKAAHARNRWVGVCGALAGDPDAVPVLVGLGVDELSVSVPVIPGVKARVRELSVTECRETAALALAANDGIEVRALVARRHGESA